MSDLISRQDVIDALMNDADWADAIPTIKSLPSSQPTTKCIAQIKVDTEEVARRIKEEYDITDGWIPCSERLPEKDELVLVTVWNDVTIAWRNIYGGWESAEDMYEKGDVTAWMPLPEPYRESGEA